MVSNQERKTLRYQVGISLRRYFKESDLIVSFYPDNCSITNLSKNSKGEIELINLGSELQTEINWINGKQSGKKDIEISSRNIP